MGYTGADLVTSLFNTFLARSDLLTFDFRLSTNPKGYISMEAAYYPLFLRRLTPLVRPCKRRLIRTALLRDSKGCTEREKSVHREVFCFRKGKYLLVQIGIIRFV